MAAVVTKTPIGDVRAPEGHVAGAVMAPLEGISAALAAGCPIWLTIDEAADLARVDREAIQNLIQEGRLRTYRFAGRRILIATASLLDLFAPRRLGEGVSESEDDGSDSSTG